MQFPPPPPHALDNLSVYHSERLREGFKRAVALGEARPLLIPWCLVGTFVLPALYLSFPHTKRPWLYRARFLVVAAVVALNIDMMRSTSSPNMASAYGVGLLASWGILWTLTVLVWMRPQFEAERVDRRPRRRAPTSPPMSPPRNNGAAVYRAVSDYTNGHANGHANGHTNGYATGYAGSITYANGDCQGRGSRPSTPPSPPSSMKSNGRAAAAAANGNATRPEMKRRKSVRFEFPPDVDVARRLEKFEYYWQAYPADSPFLERLDWAIDLCFSWRGSGWNWAIPSIPSFDRPEKPQSGELVKLGSIPLVSRSGFRRYRTYREFLWACGLSIVLGYLVLDACAVVMTRDPYFILGPNELPLPPHLAGLHPAALSVYRSAVAFAGIVAAIHMMFSFDQVVRCFVVGPLFGRGSRHELWRYPSPFGSFSTQVLDGGLAGFWGGWWHQSFRAAFAAPTAWLVRRGYLAGRGAPSTRLAGLVIAFAQSGFLHASGGVTALPRTHWWTPPLFFLASCAGVALQGALCAAFRARIEALPRPCRRAGNLAFVALWLHLTQRAFIDDLSRSALWLYEPVPFSPLRWLGLGAPGDGGWWRWGGDHLPRWHVGRRWWESGLAI